MIFNAMTQWWENCDNIPKMILDIITLFVVCCMLLEKEIFPQNNLILVFESSNSLVISFPFPDFNA